MLKAPTFARPPSVPIGASAASGATIGIVGPFSSPVVAVGVAIFLALAAGAVVIAVLGDPHAGAPQVKISVDQSHPAAAVPGVMRSRLGPDGIPAGPISSSFVAGVSPGSVDPLTAQIDPATDAGDPAGQAVITLPQGGSLGGAASSPISLKPNAQALATAPIAGLITPGPAGPLPIISKEGKTPFQAYARPFHDNGKPKVALVIGGLGLNAAATRSAIERLPPEVTLSFVPYADGLQGWIDMARANGHEVLLEIPMEPLDYPNNDPGPSTLMASSSKDDMTRRLEWLLSRATGYFGVTNYLGGRFVTVDSAMNAFTTDLKGRGLAFFDDGSAVHKGMTGLPRASADSVVDEQLASDAIDQKLNELAAGAVQRGQALGAGFAYPVTLTQVVRWAQALPQRGCQLVPASALGRK